MLVNGDEAVYQRLCHAVDAKRFPQSDALVGNGAVKAVCALEMCGAKCKKAAYVKVG